MIKNPRRTFFGILIILLILNVPVAAEPWKFAVICDTRGNDKDTPGKSCINDTVVPAIASAIARDRCDLVLVAGDLVNGYHYNGGISYEDQFNNWRRAMAPVYNAGIKVYPIRGNHENGPSRYSPPWPPVYPLPYPPVAAPGIISAFKAAFPDPYIPDNGPAGEEKLTYSFSHNNALFVGLDEYITPHKVNQPWLESQLAGSTKPHVFLFGHEPAFKLNHTNCLAYYPAERDALWNSIGAAGGRIYFCGHDHFYNRARVRDDSGHDIHQVLIGSSGAPFKKWKPPYTEGPKVIGEFHNDVDFGYLLVTIDDTRVTFEWKAWNGNGVPTWTTKDTFTYTVVKQ